MAKKLPRHRKPLRQLSAKAVKEIVEEFKLIFPAVDPVDFTIVFKTRIRDYDGSYLKGRFTTETSRKDGTWSMHFQKARIEISLARTQTNQSRIDLLHTLSHELLHGYFTKVGGIKLAGEEYLCTGFDRELWKFIRGRIARKRKLRKLVAEAGSLYGSKAIHRQAA